MLTPLSTTTVWMTSITLVASRVTTSGLCWITEQRETVGLASCTLCTDECVYVADQLSFEKGDLIGIAGNEKDGESVGTLTRRYSAHC